MPNGVVGYGGPQGVPGTLGPGITMLGVRNPTTADQGPPVVGSAACTRQKNC